MLRQQLQQRLLQKISPQQIQTIKLLEVPIMELEQRIKKELEENPLLEEGISDEPDAKTSEDIEEQEKETSDKNDEFSIEDYINEDEYIPSYKTTVNNYSPDGNQNKTIPYAGGISFTEHLENQLGLRELTEKQRTLATYIIGNIDDDGYLRRDINSIVDDVAFLQNVQTTKEELLEILQLIQELEPAGVGARSLQECLLIQLKSKDHHVKGIQLAELILKECFDEFTKKHYDKIRQRLDIDEEKLKPALDEILKLNPKPGSSFAESQDKFETVIPDFILEFKDDEFILSLNSRNIPELRISKTYNDLLSGYAANKKASTKDQKDVVTFVKQKLDSAKWFIDAIKQRQNTLMGTMQAILNYQKEYFEEGDETRLKPMILKNIAEKVGLDISTISRVVNSKYIQTHFGIFPLKYFFSEAMQTDTGEEISSREIKKILHDCISGENKRKPLPDEDLTKILNEKGYKVARRTVAKYREQLGLPVARLRKELK
jgi:RNA polymerase sigma-54 factor